MSSGNIELDQIESDSSDESIKQKRTNDSEEKTASSYSPFRKIGIYLAAIRSIITNVLIVILTTLLFIILCKELIGNTVVIEAIHVPAGLSDRGYSPEVLASRLLDEILNIYEKSITLKIGESISVKGIGAGASRTERERRMVSAGWEKTDIEVPTMGLSLKSMVRYVREFLGLEETRIQGEITHSKKGMTLRLRIVNRGKLADLQVGSEAELNKLIQLGAEEVVKATDPYALATYFSFFNSDKAEEMITHCLRNPPPEDDVWAINLHGIIRLDEKRDIFGALKSVKEALLLKPNWGVPYHNWGRILLYENKPEEAVNKFKEALNYGVKTPILFHDLGVALLMSGRRTDAVSNFKRAIKIEPGYSLAYYNWGIALAEEKKFDEAVKKWSKSIELQPNGQFARFGWDELLDQFGAEENIKINYRYASIRPVAISKFQKGQKETEKGFIELNAASLRTITSLR